MKRIFIVLLALCLCLGTVACAEEAAFVFRGQIRWGMSPEEVMDIEQNLLGKGPDYNSAEAETSMMAPGFQQLGYRESEVDGFAGPVSYVFYDGKLSMFSFGIAEPSQETKEQLLGALEAGYRKEENPEEDRLWSASGKVQGKEHTPGDKPRDELYVFTCENTVIWYFTRLDKPAVTVLNASEEYVNSVAGE